MIMSPFPVVLSLNWRLSLFSAGDVLFQMAEVHRQIQVQLEEMVCTSFDCRPFYIFMKAFCID